MDEQPPEKRKRGRPRKDSKLLDADGRDEWWRKVRALVRISPLADDKVLARQHPTYRAIVLEARKKIAASEDSNVVGILRAATRKAVKAGVIAG